MSLDLFLETLADASGEGEEGDFVELSDLSPEELGSFARVWFGLTIELQRWVVSKLVEEGEDNAELDFAVIFKMFLERPRRGGLGKSNGRPVGI